MGGCLGGVVSWGVSWRPGGVGGRPGGGEKPALGEKSALHALLRTAEMVAGLLQVIRSAQPDWLESGTSWLCN